jgi:hypothetical protein
VLIKLEMPLIPQFKLELLSVIKDYTINGGLHDSLFAGKEHIALPGADSVDSAKWEATRPIPLAADEASAYHRIDSTVATEKLQEEKGFSFLDLLPSPEIPSYNQVEGFRLGITKSVKPFSSFPLQLNGLLAYGFRDADWKYEVGLKQGLIWTTKKQSVFSASDFSGDFRGEYKDVQDVTLSLTAKYFHDLAWSGVIYSSIENSITSLIYKEDYQDIWRNQGFQLGLEYQPLRELTVNANYLNTKRQPPVRSDSAATAADSLLYAKTKFNAITLALTEETSLAGIDVSLTASLTGASRPLGSDVSFTGSTFELSTSKRLGGWGVMEIIGRFSTIYSGGLDRWNMFYFETRNKFFSKFGYFRGLYPFEFSGDRVWSVHLEHNFYDLPTRIVGIHFLDDLNLQWRLHGGIGASDIIRAETDPVVTTEGKPYAEIGFGVGNIFNIISLDATWRLNHKRETNFYPSVVVQFTF